MPCNTLKTFRLLQDQRTVLKAFCAERSANMSWRSSFRKSQKLLKNRERVISKVKCCDKVKWSASEVSTTKMAARVCACVCALSAVLVCVGAHVALTYPPARKYDLDFLDNSRTKPPCGMPKGAYCVLCYKLQFTIFEVRCVCVISHHIAIITYWASFAENRDTSTFSKGYILSRFPDKSIRENPKSCWRNRGQLPAVIGIRKLQCR